MDLDILQYSFSLAITIFVALVLTLVFYVSEKKLKPYPDYDIGIPVIEIVKELEKQELLKLVRKNKETIHRYYAGYIEKQCDDRRLVRFPCHVEGKKFKWPEKEDVSIIDEGQIKKTLNPPDFTYQNDRICPVGKQSNWSLFPFDHGCHRCWNQSLSLPFLQNNTINLYGSAAKVNSSSESICSLIANVTKWPEWNPFFNSQYSIKPFHDKTLRRDNFMKAERVVSTVKETDKIKSHVIMYRFHHFSENKIGWILLWNPRKLEFLYFLIQPIKDEEACLVTHIMGIESKLFAPSISLVSQRLRNIQDFLMLSSLHVVPSIHSSQKEFTCEEQPHHLSHSYLASSLSLSSMKVHVKEAQNTIFILVPFVQSLYGLWKTTVEYKLAVKNIESVSSLKKPSLRASPKGNVSDSKGVSKPLRRTHSDVGINPKALSNLNKCLPNTADNSNSSSVPKKSVDSESKDITNRSPKQTSELTSEDSNARNATSQEKLFQKTKLRSLSETAVNTLTDWKCSSKSVNSESDYDSFNTLEDVSEIAEDQLLALDEEDDNKELFNSSGDFEVIENNEFTENRIASFMTQGNYGAAELQAEVLIASQFLHDMNSGNYHSIGGWMFHSYHKSFCVLKKTTCSRFLTISSFLCQTEIPVAPKDVWKFVKCPQFRFICDESVKSVEILEKISNSQKLIHTYHEVSGFVKKELVDFCLLQTEREEVNKYYSCFYSIESDKCPFVKSVSRGTLRPSGWIVETVNDDPHKSIVTYVMQGLVCSPDSLFIKELGTMVPQSMYNLKNYITSKPV